MDTIKLMLLFRKFPKVDSPTEPEDKARLTEYFDPLPIWYPPLETGRIDAAAYEFSAITQRPMMMYHSWDSQNVWLRQILAQNFLYMNTRTAARLGLADFDWVWVESHAGKVRCQMKTMEGVEESTVWTWNAIGKQSGAWGLDKDASEATHGFLLNHLISESLPARKGERRLTNSDPITGQAAWFDVRVKITKSAEAGPWPVFEPLKRLPGDEQPRPAVLRWGVKP